MDIDRITTSLAAVTERENAVHAAIEAHRNAVGVASAVLREELCARLDQVSADNAKVRIAGELAASIALVWAAQYRLHDPARGWQSLASYVFDTLCGSGWTCSGHGTSDPNPHQLQDEGEITICLNRTAS